MSKLTKFYYHDGERLFSMYGFEKDDDEFNDEEEMGDEDDIDLIDTEEE